MTVNRLMTNLLCSDLETSKAFFTALLDLEVVYDSDWFVVLKAPVNSLELGLISKTHNVVPSAARQPSGGLYLTFVVEDVEDVHSKAQALGAPVIERPTDTPYGQRRMVIKSPDGHVLDISSPTSGEQN